MDSRNYDITMVDQWEESKTPVYDVSVYFPGRDTRTSVDNNCEAGTASVTDNKGRTMTVRDLITELEKLNPIAPVVIKDKNGLKVGADITVQDMGVAVFLTGNDLAYPDPKRIEDCVWMIDHEVKAVMEYAQQLRKLCNNEPV